MKELIPIDKDILEAAQNAVKGAVASVQILRDDGSFYRRRQYGLSESAWNEQVLASLQTLAVSAIDAVMFKVFLMAIDRLDAAERLAIESLLEQWDLFRAKVALMGGPGKKGDEDESEDTPAEGQDEGHVQGEVGPEVSDPTDAAPAERDPGGG